MVLVTDCQDTLLVYLFLHYMTQRHILSDLALRLAQMLRGVHGDLAGV